MNQYHTSLKVCYSLGLQEQLIDKSVRDRIPASTKHYWIKTTKPGSIIGIELSKRIDADLAALKAGYHPANAIPRAAFDAYCKFVVTIIGILEPSKLKKALRGKMEVFINALDEAAGFFSYGKAAALLSLSTKTLYHWRTKVKFRCEASSLLLCVRRHPNQATASEVNVIRTFLNDQQYAHWGIHSIWAFAFRNGLTKLSRQSWYHYNSLLAFRQGTGKAKKPPYHPLRATVVNQIWHADITVFKVNNVKYYIYTVMDNYSRYVHSWKVAPVVSAEIRMQTIREAIGQVFSNDPGHNVQLVTDGGPENNNQTMKAFIASCHVSIHHTIALRDIVQSNSMQEAFYATAKYRFLYRLVIDTPGKLIHHVDEMMQEYNTIRPHYALNT